MINLVYLIIALTIAIFISIIIIKNTSNKNCFLRSQTNKLQDENTNLINDKLKLQNEKTMLINNMQDLQSKYDKLLSTLDTMKSNLTAFPYMAGMIADIETYGLEKLALGLSWGSSQERLKKVKAIREIRNDARAMVEKNKYSQYQLAYLLELFPALADVIECDFNNLPPIEVSELSEYDKSRDYLSREEYANLTSVERNQLALDRYQTSHAKTKWEIGRDYEQYVGYKLRESGYEVEDFGSLMKLDDLGRDIIAKKNNITLIIQCKYWSSIKEIHEKHITQLYGTTVSYCIENNIDPKTVKPILVTNITLSKTAKKMASYLGVDYAEHYELGAYPCIKCNIGHDGYITTKIYHLPFDQQYDRTKISKTGEFYAMTVAEAEAAGFRRTYKWYGN